MKIKMTIICMIVAFATSVQAMDICSGESSDTIVDLRSELVVSSAFINYNSAWIRGNPSAEVVILDNGTEIKRVIGEGDFAWSPTTAGKHTLMYTTYIDGVAQDEVYTATVFKDWKYTVEDGKATIVETTQKSGSVTIPSEIDGYPVVGLDEGLFKGCEGLTSIVIPDSITVIKGQCLYDLTQNAWVILYDESDDETIVYKSNDISHNGSTYMTMTVEGPLELSFDWKVSSESDWDYLKWYLDGTEKSEISGTGSDWQTVNISIPTGEHTIKWQYSKDGSADNGEDCGWVRLPSDVTGLRSDAFEGCSSITNITLEGAVSALPIDIINQCSSLESLKLSQTSLEVRLKDKNKWEVIENGVFKSATIGDGESSTMEARVFGSGKFTFKWKASSEYYEDEIYDYATLKVDGDEVDTIGGHTSWRDVEIELIGAKEHVISWVYKKDAVDEDNVGDDCVWVTSIKFRPERMVAFDVGTADGVAPLPITINTESIVKLPVYQGFDFPKYTLTGWNDGLRIYSPGAEYTVPLTNVVLTAVYEPNTLSEPVIYTRDVTNGGVLEKEAASITLLGDDGCKIYYTIDGSEPSSQSMLYTSAFSVDKLGDVVIKAIAIKENYFDSAITTFSYRRRAYSPEECLNNSYFDTSSGGNKAWYRVIEEEAHDGDAALRSGIINDNETSSISIVVEGEGSVSFWWKTSSEINRGNKYDYVSFMVDDVEQKWMGGITDWSNIVCQVSGQGSHTLRWVYQKNGNGVSKGEDCAWLDEVMWRPAGAIPELGDGASSEMITLVLSGVADAKLAANIKDAAEYAAFRAWTMGLSGISSEQVKASPNAWLSYALNTDKLIEGEISDGDLKIETFTFGSEDGVFDMKVRVADASIGPDAALSNLIRAFVVEGTPSLTEDFSVEKVAVAFGEPDGGAATFSISPREIANAFFVRTRLRNQANGDRGNGCEVSFNLNGGGSLPEGMKVKKFVEYASAYGELPTPTREGYRFLGWYTSPEGGELISSDTAMSILATQTLYARWMEADPLYCVIDLSAGVNAASYPVTYLSDVPAGGWTDEYKTTKLVLRRIEPGSFKMNGSYDVTIAKAFYCGVFEVTQKQYELVTGSKPSNFSGDKLPVEQVSWNMIRGNSDTYNWPTIKTVDPDSFIGRLQARTGLNFDLPTEAQWEYACRAGTTTTYSYGDSANGEYMWNSNGSASESHDVGTKLSNPWGLYDMHGNVWEWCLDWRGTLSGGLDPEGASSGWERINRGGGSSGGASYCTSAYRNYTGPEEGWLNVGFRLVGNLSE